MVADLPLPHASGSGGTRRRGSAVTEFFPPHESGKGYKGRWLPSLDSPSLTGPAAAAAWGGAVVVADSPPHRSADGAEARIHVASLPSPNRDENDGGKLPGGGSEDPGLGSGMSAASNVGCGGVSTTTVARVDLS